MYKAIKNRFLFATAIVAFLPSFLSSQDLDARIRSMEAVKAEMEDSIQSLNEHLETAKLERGRRDISAMTLPAHGPNDTIVWHSAMAILYDQHFKQARWVAHIISPDIATGNLSRTNDFRPDPAVKGGTATDADYFVAVVNPDSTITYKDFGYDRGHLAPSADFKWSQTALSESYFFSNISPQVPDMNRGKWAELEGVLRGYVYVNRVPLHVVTGPILTNDLPTVPQSPKHVSVPKYFYKAVLDPTNRVATGFLMPNQKMDNLVDSYAVPIDSLEKLTGLDFFPNLPDTTEARLEKSSNGKAFVPKAQQKDVEPLDQKLLPKRAINTAAAYDFAEKGDVLWVCGTVVSTKLTKNGHIFLNLDKRFPNQVFTITIWKSNVANFSYSPDIDLNGQMICAKGKIRLNRGTPTMDVTREEDIQYFKPNAKKGK